MKIYDVQRKINLDWSKLLKLPANELQQPQQSQFKVSFILIQAVRPENNTEW